MIFTVVLLIFEIIALIFGSETAFLRDAVFMFYLFSFLEAAVSCVLGADKLHIALRVVIHYVLTAVIFYLTFILLNDPYKTSTNGTTVIIILAAFTVLYFAAIIPYCAVKSKKAKKAVEEKGYKNAFS